MCTYSVMFALGVETMAVSPAASISVIGLIIDASIPAGAWQAARNTAVAERRGGGGGEREREEDRNGGIRANSGRHLECYSCSGLP